MVKADQRGNPVSYGSQDAIERLDRVCNLMHAYQAAPLTEVDTIIAQYPDLYWRMRFVRVLSRRQRTKCSNRS